MKIEHIVSTMNRDNYDFLNELHIQHNCLVINQNMQERYEEFLMDGMLVRIISTPERGLSNSRNMLLKNAEGDICIIGDDDVLYLDGYTQRIENAYETYPDADIIAFLFTEEMGKDTRKRCVKAGRLNIFSISKVASVEITLKRKSILSKGLAFDSRIGLGSPFPLGEENAFLADALRAGLRIYQVPISICFTQPVTASMEQKWGNGFDKAYFVAKGAAFYRIYRHLFLLFAFAFILAKKRSLFKNVPLCKAAYWMIKGKRKYKFQGKESHNVS
ncbi:MAG: hypothetical protein K0S55_1401 [Clostridia bacterium]|nr:hypothetical protein [Clostridia bacterium]